MDIINNDTDNIDKYYSSVDKNVINHLCTDNNIKNLIHLSINTELNPFNKSKKKWNLKSKRKLLKECENIKKKEVKEISFHLNNLSKLGNNNIDNLKNIYKKSENKMDTLHKLINCINNIDLLSQESSNNIVENILEQKESSNNINHNQTNMNKDKITYIVDYDNKHKDKHKSNIVSFDIVNIKKKPKKNNKIINVTIINNLQSESPTNYLECFGNC
jgi:hypothetical protein